MTRKKIIEEQAAKVYVLRFLTRVLTNELNEIGRSCQGTHYWASTMRQFRTELKATTKKLGWEETVLDMLRKI